MTILFRCAPEHEGLLPKPVPAKGHLPDWLRKMPAAAFSEIAGADVRTLKQCPPFIDAMSAGFLMPLPCDLTFRGGTFQWASPLPPFADTLDGRSPLGVHVPEQAIGAPFGNPDSFIIKFMNFWAIETPPGLSVLFTHPFNRDDLPFRTLSGVVDCDLYGLGTVHFPALWQDQNFEGTLAAGTPVAQCIPFQREATQLSIRSFTAAEIAQRQQLQLAMVESSGVYRRLSDKRN